MVGDGTTDPLAALSESISSPREAERDLERAALEEVYATGCVSYMGARNRRLLREMIVAASHADPAGDL